MSQENTITTYDLGVVMKALPIIWNDPERYNKHVILVGTFHFLRAYMKMLGEKMAGSGLSDILLEAGLISGGSLTGVMSGKRYKHALHCHKTMLESLENLLFARFSRDQPLPQLDQDSLAKLEAAEKDPSMLTVEEALQDEGIKGLLNSYIQYWESGGLGKTAELWMAYMRHVRLMLTLLEAVKTNNFLLLQHYIYSNSKRNVI